jgi:hypothetical protein
MREDPAAMTTPTMTCQRAQTPCAAECAIIGALRGHASRPSTTSGQVSRHGPAGTAPGTLADAAPRGAGIIRSGARRRRGTGDVWWGQMYAALRLPWRCCATMDKASARSRVQSSTPDTNGKPIPARSHPRSRLVRSTRTQHWLRHLALASASVDFRGTSLNISPHDLIASHPLQGRPRLASGRRARTAAATDQVRAAGRCTRLQPGDRAFTLLCTGRSAAHSRS